MVLLVRWDGRWVGGRRKSGPGGLGDQRAVPEVDEAVDGETMAWRIWLGDAPGPGHTEPRCGAPRDSIRRPTPCDRAVSGTRTNIEGEEHGGVVALLQAGHLQHGVLGRPSPCRERRPRAGLRSWPRLGQLLADGLGAGAGGEQHLEAVAADGLPPGWPPGRAGTASGRCRRAMRTPPLPATLLAAGSTTTMPTSRPGGRCPAAEGEGRPCQRSVSGVPSGRVERAAGSGRWRRSATSVGPAGAAPDGGPAMLEGREGSAGGRARTAPSTTSALPAWRCRRRRPSRRTR